jgi:Protein of unknown function (DUF3828)
MLRIITTVLAFGCLVPSVAMAEDAAAVVRNIYAQYENKNGVEGDGVKDILDKSLYSARVDKLIDKITVACKDAQEICGPDVDFLIDGQDYLITKVKVKTVKSSDNAASVEARFLNIGIARKITFSMVKEGETWVIDDLVAAKNGNYGGYRLDEVLKP